MINILNENQKLILIYNAKIYNSDGIEDYDWMLFDKLSGYIREVGKIDNRPKSLDNLMKIDMNGSRVLPGLHDSHIHVHNIGRKFCCCDLYNCRSIDEMKTIIYKFARNNPQFDAIFCTGWEHDKLGRMPTKQDLDSIDCDKPIFAYRICNHICVVNSKTLQMVNYDNETMNPFGGTIERDSNGNLNGILKENAINKAYELMNELVHNKFKVEYLQKGLNLCLENGLTAVHSNEIQSWNELCDLANKKLLPIRVFMATYYHTLSDNRPDYAGEIYDHLLSCDRIKIFVDGSLGGSTAAMSLPYLNDENNLGLLLNEQEELNRKVKNANENGYRLEIHVIGDAAVQAALDALEYANVDPLKRPLLTHAQILRKDLLPRMKKQGCIANIQPPFVTSDSAWLHLRLQEPLLEYAYVWKTLLNFGIHCAGGSDSPVESCNPFLGIYDAVYRNIETRSINSKIHKPEEKLNIREAIDLYTKGGAYATMREHNLGKLKSGYLADFVVIDRDICADPRLLLDVKVKEVWVAGICKYQSIN